MFHKPKVSVIIPSYNSEKHLQKAVDSVINQTLKQIEIILIDDGSTDKTATLLQQYKMKDNRVEVYTHPKNLGLGPARNTGIKQANGEYISFLDSDDYFHLNFLESLYEKASAEDLEILQAQYVIHASDEKKVLPQDMIPFAHPISGIDYYNEGILIEPQAWSKLWKTDFFKKHNLAFATGYYEDMMMVHDAFSKAEKVNNLIFPGYHYILHKNSITGQQLTAKHINDYKNVVQNLQALFMNSHLTKQSSSFPVSYGLYLVHLCNMAQKLNQDELLTEVKEFIKNLLQKYGSFIRKNKNLQWQKRYLLSKSPCLYAKLKKAKN